MVEPLNYPFKKHPDTSKDGKMHTNNFFNILVGGLIINDKDASNTKLVIEIIKNLSKKVNFFMNIFVS